MAVHVNEPATYFFVVHGIVPELMPRGSTAQRRAKHYNTRGMKILKCPYCRGEFDTVDSTAKVEVRCFSRKAKETIHHSIPCRICHNEVGIVYVSA